uniref:riboflavin kinase n=1 Tax=Geotrypetes seraphini TaxID=260995 RepID=A0A6P8Q6X8_GEOSA|nr:riboflavin kinase isoform X1 [Geotrypetes seraphini]
MCWGLVRSFRLRGLLPSRCFSCCDSAAMKHLPYFCRGEVVRGFGRGSKELGIPTANFPEHVVDSLPLDLTTGIYYGWGCVANEGVHKIVVSIGWNPYYKNVKKSMDSRPMRIKPDCSRLVCLSTRKKMETHLIHPFKEDFYGEMLSVIIVGYIRPEKSFNSLDSLISAIHSDIEEAKKRLDLPEFNRLKDDNFFNTHSQIMNGH